MPSNRFLNKVQDVALKARVISRKKSPEELLDDAWLYEESNSNETTSTTISYYDSTEDRVAEKLKRETARKAKSEKRTFGYQLPLTELDDQNSTEEREVKRNKQPLRFRLDAAPRTQNASLYFDIKQ